MDTSELASLHQAVAELLNEISHLSDCVVLGEIDLSADSGVQEFLSAANRLIVHHDVVADQADAFVAFDRAYLELSHGGALIQGRDSSLHRRALRLAGELIESLAIDDELLEPITASTIDHAESIAASEQAHNRLDELFEDDRLIEGLDREYACALRFAAPIASNDTDTGDQSGSR